MKTVRRDSEWWIVGCRSGAEYGPYATRAEADDDRRGLERFWSEEHVVDDQGDDDPGDGEPGNEKREQLELFG